jgi:hypothetical protein
MKIFNKSLLLFKINPNTDKVKCIWIFWISGITFKTERITFDLKIMSLSKVLEFHKQLADDYTCKYRV